MRRGCKRKYISTEEGKQEGTEEGRKEGRRNQAKRIMKT